MVRCKSVPQEGKSDEHLVAFSEDEFPGGTIMRSTTSNQGTVFQFPWSRAVRRDARRQRQPEGLSSELQDALARETALRVDKQNLLQQQKVLAQEFEHRLDNSLQSIVGLLTLQSRTATSSEAAAQLTMAAQRVSAIGRVHHQLHRLDHQDKVEFKEYLEHLCADLSDLLVLSDTASAIAVEGATVEIPTAFAIPLGFIVNELVINSTKYAKGNIIVRLVKLSPGRHSLSVLDDGAGLPAGFNPACSTGLGMKIVRSLVKQIEGQLEVHPGDDGDR